MHYAEQTSQLCCLSDTVGHSGPLEDLGFVSGYSLILPRNHGLQEWALAIIPFITFWSMLRSGSPPPRIC